MKETDQIRFGKQRGLTLQFRDVTDRRFEQLFLSGNLRHQQVAEVGQQIATEVSQVVPAHHHVVYDSQRLDLLDSNEVMCPRNSEDIVTLRSR